MGLKKQEDLNLGPQPTDNYHRIVNVSLDPKGASMSVNVASWWDKASRDAGKDSYMSRTFTIAIDGDLQNVLSNAGGLGAATDLLAELYPKIKASTEHDSFFFDAVDINPDP